MRLLVVEDNVVHARVLRSVLEQLGRPVSVHHAGTVTSACARLQAESFDVVLADVHLPDVQGAAVMARLAEAAPSVPIVAVSAVDDPAVVQAVLAAGAHDLLLKDRVTPDLLLHALVRAVQRAPGRTAAAEGQLLDAVTGVFNRRGLQLATAKALAFARRHRHPVTVVHLQVAGTSEDTVELVRLLARTVRDADLVGRVATHHLAIVLPDDRSDPPAVLGRLQGRLAERTAGPLAFDVIVRRFDPETPVSADELLRLPAGEAPAAATRPARRALVVSEDGDLRATVASALGSGWTVLEAAGPGSAVRMAALEEPHVIVVDLHRADGDGLAVVRQVAEQPETAGVPMVGIFGDGAEVPVARTVGLAGAITRDRVAAELGAVVDRALR